MSGARIPSLARACISALVCGIPRYETGGRAGQEGSANRLHGEFLLHPNVTGDDLQKQLTLGTADDGNRSPQVGARLNAVTND